MADLADIRIGIDVETADVSRAVDKFEALKRKAAQLKLELNKGNITSKAYNRGIQQMAGQLGKVTGNANQAKSAMMQYRYAIENATDQQLKFATSSGKGMRRMEILAQQAGYQIGDLAVQIQSGTNAAVAFGQQGSQLLGFFGPMGALAGAGLAITTGLVAPFFKAKDTAKETEDAFRKIGEALDELESVTFDDNLRGGLLKTVKEIRGEFESSLKIVKELAAEQLKTEIKTPLKGLREQFLEYEKARKVIEVGGGAPPDFNILGFEDPERFVQTFQLLNEIQGNTREELQKSVDAAAFWLQGSGLLNEEVKKLLKGYIDVVGTVESVSKAVDTAKDNEKTGISETEKLRRKLAKERADTMEDFYKRRRKASLDAAAAEKKAEEDALKLYDDKYSKQDTINKLLFSEIKYGKDNAEYKALQNSLQDEQLKKEIELLKLSDTQKKSLVSLIDEQRRLLDQLDEEEEKRKRIADLIIPPALAAKGTGYAALSGELALRQATGLGVVEDKTDKKTKAKESMASIIKGMEEEANLQRKLVGLSDQEADRLQILYDLKEQNKDASGKMTEAQLKQAAERIAAINAETAAMEAQMQKVQDVADSFETHFGDALMGIVTDFDILNGSIEDFGYNAEQVFKNMAREIIKELYRIFVVKKITGFISAAVGDVGSLYQGSTGFMQFSGGGYTGSGPRSGGLDGKGGFLAMLHPKETVIDHTKGQSAEGVTVVQNINISTGVQQTVRNEIRTLMPQIANSAKAAVSDAKRRGGSYGRAFS